MIRSVVREHHWPPDIIGGFYVDGDMYDSLEFWFDDVVNTNEKK
jgi:hypothetical protein